MSTIKSMRKRKNKLAVVILIAASTVTTATNAGGEAAAATPPDIAEVKKNAKAYVGSLKALLQKKMGEGGPVAALDVCGTEGARIGGEIGRETGWSIRRASNKPRNPLAIPDEYEAKMLDIYSERIAKQPDTTDLAKYEVVNENGVNYARFTKGIRMKPLCLTCHGDKATMSTVDEKLTQLYPHDKARGYKVGDLRGVLSIKIKLD